jgi:lysyl-tRNA synthetase class 2
VPAVAWRRRADGSYEVVFAGGRSATGRDALELRARLLTRVRAFFAERAVLEVDTPILSQGATTDPQIESLRTEVRGAGTRWLHTSPELPMKRLLAAGTGDVYQLCTQYPAGRPAQLWFLCRRR